MSGPTGAEIDALRNGPQGMTWREIGEVFGEHPEKLRARWRRWQESGNQDDDVHSFVEDGPAVQAAVTGLNTSVVESRTAGAVKSLDQLLTEAAVDLDVWRVDRWVVNKWPVGAKAERKRLRWKDGRIEEGYVESDGLTIAQLWQVKAWLVRREPRPLFPTIQPVACESRYEAVVPAVAGEGDRVVRRSLVWSDPHFGFSRNLETGALTPLHDGRALDVILQIGVALGVDGFHCLGDVFDLAEASDHFVRKPEFKECFQPAILAAHSYFARVRQALPDARMTVHEGNHDARLIMATIKHLQAAYDLRAADELELPPALSVPRLLALHELGIEWIGGYPGDEDWLNDGIRMSHGEVARTPPGASARAVVDVAEVTELFGHVHRLESASRTIHTRGGQRTVRAVCVGCACHIDGRVPSASSRLNWQQGCAIVDYVLGGRVHNVALVRIEDGEAVVGGRRFVGRVRDERRVVDGC